MNLKRIALSAAVGIGLLASLPAFAHGWGHGYRHSHYFHGAPAYVYYPAQPVVVMPPPVVYAPPPPVVYAPAAPVIYGRIPVRPGVTVGFGVRL